MRTFITSDDSRDDLVAHVYDINYGTVQSSDNLVMIDDSIVRGTTLKQSIIRILDRLSPKKNCNCIFRAHKLDILTVTESTWQKWEIL